MDYAKIVYKYINRGYDYKEVLNALKEVDSTNYSSDDKKLIKELIERIDNAYNTIPNEEDEYLIKDEEKLKGIISNLTIVLNNFRGTDEDKGKLTQQLESLKGDLNKKRDGGKLFIEISNIFKESEFIDKLVDNMSIEEELDLINTFICAPFPFNIDENEFKKLVDYSIKNDKRESLWRLAFNYEDYEFDFTEIIDYFILKRDYWYLVELMSAISETIDEKYKGYIFDNVMQTKDIDFMNKCASYGLRVGVVTEEELKELKELLDSEGE